MTDATPHERYELPEDIRKLRQELNTRLERPDTRPIVWSLRERADIEEETNNT